MTITAQTAKTGPYSGNGSTTVFSYTFKVVDEGHLVVTLLDADGVTETVQTLTTDYTITGVGNASGGTVIMATAPAVGEQLTITRSVPIAQTIDLQNRGALNPEVLEAGLDQLTQIVQDQQQQIDRALKVDLFETADLDQLTLNVNALAAISDDVSTVAGISTDVSTVADADAEITIVATNIADVTSFSRVYLGASATDPTERADTSALEAGDLYFNTVDGLMKVYNGSSWLDAYADLSLALIASNNLSDIPTPATARTNLGLGSGDSPTFTAVTIGGSTISSTDAARLDAFAAYVTGGILVQTGATAFVARGIVGTTDQVVVSNGFGASGNPTISLSFANQATVEAGTDTVSPVNSLGVTQAIAERRSEILHVRDEKPSGTDGGTFTSGAWRTRTLNTVKVNGIAGASLASDQITLPAGTYNVRARAPAREVQLNSVKLYNVTDGVDALIGSNTALGSGSMISGDAWVLGQLTIEATKAFELQHRSNTSQGTYGFGSAMSFGVVEVYAEVWIEKVA